MVVRLFMKVPYYIYYICKCSKEFEGAYELGFERCKHVTKKANKAGRVKIEAYGMDKLPKENGFIFYPNHQGLFDVLVFLESSTRPFSFVFKKEVKDVILLKQVIGALRAIPIDRKDLRQSITVIKTMAEEVTKGKNFIIFAEGTRRKKGNELLDFKGGSFKAAVKAKCPIVPCALIDSYIPFDVSSIKPVTVKLYYLDPIYYDEYKEMSTTEIAKLVKERIEEAIEMDRKREM